MKTKNIYELELHEQIITEENLTILRVPGGWIYKFPSGSTEFVKMNEEFNKKITCINVDELIKFIEGYFLLPNPIKETKYKGGKYPIAKMILSKLLQDNTNLDQTVISKLLGYENRTSITNAITRLNGLLETKDNDALKYYILKDRLKLK